MVRKIKQVAVKQEKSIEEVIAENKRLTETIEKLGTTPATDKTLVTYMEEMSKISKKARVDSDKIKVVEITDHKNISLWTKAGKRIGPLHRENAIVAFKNFFNLGIMLSTEQPTAEQIEAYKQTDEYKKAQAKLAASRAIKDKSKKAGQMQKLAEAIAKMSGTTVEAINHVLKAHEIKSLADGQSSAGLK